MNRIPGASLAMLFALLAPAAATVAEEQAASNTPQPTPTGTPAPAPWGYYPASGFNSSWWPAAPYWGWGDPWYDDGYGAGDWAGDTGFHFGMGAGGHGFGQGYGYPDPYGSYPYAFPYGYGAYPPPQPQPMAPAPAPMEPAVPPSLAAQPQPVETPPPAPQPEPAALPTPPAPPIPAETPPAPPVVAQPAPQPAPVVAAPAIADADQDGVTDGDDLCPQSPLGSQVDALGCPGNVAISLEGVNFKTNSDELLPESTLILDRVAKTLLAHPELRLEVAGHTDKAGNGPYNKNLSQRRADKVRTYLLGKGISAEMLTARGYGEDQPITTNATVEGRAKNRRVELRRR